MHYIGHKMPALLTYCSADCMRLFSFSYSIIYSLPEAGDVAPLSLSTTLMLSVLTFSFCRSLWALLCFMTFSVYMPTTPTFVQSKLLRQADAMLAMAKQSRNAMKSLLAWSCKPTSAMQTSQQPCKVLGVGCATSDALPGAGGQVNHNIDHAKVVICLPSCSRQCIRSGRLV